MREFTLLMLAHVLGDYWFQPQSLARAKSRNLGWVLLHALIYAASCALMLLFLGGGFIFALAAAAGTHLIIDMVKQAVLNTLAKKDILTVKGERAAFIIDQTLHIGVALAVAFLVSSRFPSEVPPYMVSVGAALHTDAYRVLNFAVMGLAAVKPANVFIRRILVTEKPDEAPLHRERLRAGSYIGGLERLLVIALLALGQYGSIAIVFTAKSIARFRQLDDREFAEYYIFGTLLSIVTAVGIFMLMKLFGAYLPA